MISKPQSQTHYIVLEDKFGIQRVGSTVINLPFL